MAITNRGLDQSEQRKVVGTKLGATATGVTAIVDFVAYPCVLEKAQFAAFGLSGAPTYQLVVNRFIAGAGATAINVGSANAVPAFGTSGVLAVGASLPASGSTLLNLLPGDVVMVLSAGANTAATGLAVSMVLRPIQDIKINFGLI